MQPHYTPLRLIRTMIQCLFQKQRGSRRHKEKERTLEREKGEKRQKKRKERGREEEECGTRINKNIVCDGCIRIDANISHIRSENTGFVQEAHLDKCPCYEAPNHFMTPCC